MAGPTADGSALRREDPPLVTGAAHYGDGLFPPGMLPGVFVRAPLAHGRIVGVDPSVAAGLPGVAGVFCATDLDLPPMPAGDGPAAMARPVLAADVVRFQGEAVAVVGAETRAQALGAAGRARPGGRARRRRSAAVPRRHPGQGAALARAVAGPRGRRGGGPGAVRETAGGAG